MARFDIMPYKAPGGPGCIAGGMPYASGAGFQTGEVLRVNGNVLDEIAAGVVNPSDLGAVGIAMADRSDLDLAFDTDGDGDASDDGALAPFVVMDDTSYFVTANVFNNSDTLVTPAATHRGVTCALRRTAGGVHGVDVGATSEEFVIEMVLDSRGNEISQSGGTGAAVVFRRIS